MEARLDRFAAAAEAALGLPGARAPVTRPIHSPSLGFLTAFSSGYKAIHKPFELMCAKLNKVEIVTFQYTI